MHTRTPRLTGGRSTGAGWGRGAGRRPGAPPAAGSPVVGTVLVEEAPELPTHLGVLRRAPTEAAVGHRLEDVELRVDPGCTELAVHPHGVGQEEVPGAGLEEGGREAREVGEQRRQVEMSQVVATRV